MLTTIPELPDNVIGLTAKGEVTRSDYREVLEPAVTPRSPTTRKSACSTSSGTT